MLSQSEIANAWGHGCYHGKFATVALFGAGHASIRPEIIEAASAMSACLSVWDYPTEASDTGGYACRHKTGSSETSNHGRGIAIDVNWRLNPYGHTLVTNMPRAMIQAICGIRTHSGAQVWNWGGNWSGNKDAMHFEVVCSPADLASGINWATVPAEATPPTIEDTTMDVTYIRRNSDGAICRITPATQSLMTGPDWVFEQKLYAYAHNGAGIPVQPCDDASFDIMTTSRLDARSAPIPHGPPVA